LSPDSGAQSDTSGSYTPSRTPDPNAVIKSYVKMIAKT
jgi:hypothetical protein